MLVFVIFKGKSPSNATHFLSVIFSSWIAILLIRMLKISSNRDSSERQKNQIEDDGCQIPVCIICGNKISRYSMTPKKLAYHFFLGMLFQ